MLKQSIPFLFIIVLFLSSCLNGEVVRLNYKNTLITTFLLPDSVQADTTYVLNLQPSENPLDVLLDSFKVSRSSIQKVQIDTAFIKISELNSSRINLGFLDSMALFMVDGEDVLIGTRGDFATETEKGFRVSDGINLRNQLLDNSLQLKLFGFTAKEIKDSVFLEFTLNLTITGEAK